MGEGEIIIPTQQQEDVIPTPYMYPSIPQENTANIIMQTNPDRIIDEIEHLLKGEVYNFEYKCYEKKGDTWLNDKGVAQIIIIAKSVINQNTILSNLDIKEIEKLIINLADELTMLLKMRYQEFEVDKARLTSIVNLVTRMAYCSLKRAYLADEKKFLRTSVRSQETIIQRPQSLTEKKPAIPNPFKIFKRGD